MRGRENESKVEGKWKDDGRMNQKPRMRDVEVEMPVEGDKT